MVPGHGTSPGRCCERWTSEIESQSSGGGAMPEPTQHTRSDVWHELLDTARHARYYHSLSARYGIYYRGLRMLLLLAATGSVGTLLNFIPPQAQEIIAGAVGIIAAFELFSDFGPKYVTLRQAALECEQLETKLRRLWSVTNLPDAVESNVREELTLLQNRRQEAVSRADRANVRESRRLNRKSATKAYAILEEEFAPNAT